MDNCYSFKIPKDEVAHCLPLAAAADIAELTLMPAREHEENKDDIKSKF